MEVTEQMERIVLTTEEIALTLWVKEINHLEAAPITDTNTSCNKWGVMISYGTHQDTLCLACRDELQARQYLHHILRVMQDVLGGQEKQLDKNMQRTKKLLKEMQEDPSPAPAGE